MRSTQARLQDILEAIAQIETQQQKGKAAFDENELIQVWMVHYLMIIGEAVRSLDPAFKQKYSSIPWRQISGMRNILVHDYFRIDKRLVWETVENEIPKLKTRIEELLRALK